MPCRDAPSDVPSHPDTRSSTCPLVPPSEYALSLHTAFFPSTFSKMTTEQTLTETRSRAQETQYKDCLSCRIIGTGALGAVGLYALHQSRAHQPGSLIGKRIMASVGVLFLVGSAMRATLWSVLIVRVVDERSSDNSGMCRRLTRDGVGRHPCRCVRGVLVICLRLLTVQTSCPCRLALRRCNDIIIDLLRAQALRRRAPTFCAA